MAEFIDRPVANTSVPTLNAAATISAPLHGGAPRMRLQPRRQQVPTLPGAASGEFVAGQAEGHGRRTADTTLQASSLVVTAHRPRPPSPATHSSPVSHDSRRSPAPSGGAHAAACGSTASRSSHSGSFHAGSLHAGSFHAGSFCVSPSGAAGTERAAQLQHRQTGAAGSQRSLGSFSQPSRGSRSPTPSVSPSSAASALDPTAQAGAAAAEGARQSAEVPSTAAANAARQSDGQSSHRQPMQRGRLGLFDSTGDAPAPAVTSVSHSFYTRQAEPQRAVRRSEYVTGPAVVRAASSASAEDHPPASGHWRGHPEASTGSVGSASAAEQTLAGMQARQRGLLQWMLHTYPEAAAPNAMRDKSTATAATPGPSDSIVSAMAADVRSAAADSAITRRSGVLAPSTARAAPTVPPLRTPESAASPLRSAPQQEQLPPQQGELLVQHEQQPLSTRSDAGPCFSTAYVAMSSLAADTSRPAAPVRALASNIGAPGSSSAVRTSSVPTSAPAASTVPTRARESPPAAARVGSGAAAREASPHRAQRLQQSTTAMAPPPPQGAPLRSQPGAAASQGGTGSRPQRRERRAADGWLLGPAPASHQQQSSVMGAGAPLHSSARIGSPAATGSAQQSPRLPLFDETGGTGTTGTLVRLEKGSPSSRHQSVHQTGAPLAGKGDLPTAEPLHAAAAQSHRAVSLAAPASGTVSPARGAAARGSGRTLQAGSGSISSPTASAASASSSHATAAAAAAASAAAAAAGGGLDTSGALTLSPQVARLIREEVQAALHRLGRSSAHTGEAVATGGGGHTPGSRNASATRAAAAAFFLTPQYQEVAAAAAATAAAAGASRSGNAAASAGFGGPSRGSSTGRSGGSRELRVHWTGGRGSNRSSGVGSGSAGSKSLPASGARQSQRRGRSPTARAAASHHEQEHSRQQQWRHVCGHPRAFPAVGASPSASRTPSKQPQQRQQAHTQGSPPPSARRSKGGGGGGGTGEISSSPERGDLSSPLSPRVQSIIASWVQGRRRSRLGEEQLRRIEGQRQHEREQLERSRSRSRSFGAPVGSLTPRRRPASASLSSAATASSKRRQAAQRQSWSGRSQRQGGSVDRPARSAGGVPGGSGLACKAQCRRPAADGGVRGSPGSGSRGASRGVAGAGGSAGGGLSGFSTLSQSAAARLLASQLPAGGVSLPRHLVLEGMGADGSRSGGSSVAGASAAALRVPAPVSTAATTAADATLGVQRRGLQRPRVDGDAHERGVTNPRTIASAVASEPASSGSTAAASVQPAGRGERLTTQRERDAVARVPGGKHSLPPAVRHLVTAGAGSDSSAWPAPSPGGAGTGTAATMSPHAHAEYLRQHARLMASLGGTPVAAAAAHGVRGLEGGANLSPPASPARRDGSPHRGGWPGAAGLPQSPTRETRFLLRGPLSPPREALSPPRGADSPSQRSGSPPRSPLSPHVRPLAPPQTPAGPQRNTAGLQPASDELSDAETLQAPGLQGAGEVAEPPVHAAAAPLEATQPGAAAAAAPKQQGTRAAAFLPGPSRGPTTATAFGESVVEPAAAKAPPQRQYRDDQPSALQASSSRSGVAAPDAAPQVAPASSISQPDRPLHRSDLLSAAAVAELLQARERQQVAGPVAPAGAPADFDMATEAHRLQQQQTLQQAYQAPMMPFRAASAQAALAPTVEVSAAVPLAPATQHGAVQQLPAETAFAAAARGEQPSIAHTRETVAPPGIASLQAELLASGRERGASGGDLSASMLLSATTADQNGTSAGEQATAGAPGTASHPEALSQPRRVPPGQLPLPQAPSRRELLPIQPPQAPQQQQSTTLLHDQLQPQLPARQPLHQHAVQQTHAYPPPLSYAAESTPVEELRGMQPAAAEASSEDARYPPRERAGAAGSGGVSTHARRVQAEAEAAFRAAAQQGAPLAPACAAAAPGSPWPPAVSGRAATASEPPSSSFAGGLHEASLPQQQRGVERQARPAPVALSRHSRGSTGGEAAAGLEEEAGAKQPKPRSRSYALAIAHAAAAAAGVPAPQVPPMPPAAGRSLPSALPLNGPQQLNTSLRGGGRQHENDSAAEYTTPRRQRWAGMEQTPSRRSRAGEGLPAASADHAWAPRPAAAAAATGAGTSGAPARGFDAASILAAHAAYSRYAAGVGFGPSAQGGRAGAAAQPAAAAVPSITQSVGPARAVPQPFSPDMGFNGRTTGADDSSSSRSRLGFASGGRLHPSALLSASHTHSHTPQEPYPGQQSQRGGAEVGAGVPVLDRPGGVLVAEGALPTPLPMSPGALRAAFPLLRGGEEEQQLLARVFAIATRGMHRGMHAGMTAAAAPAPAGAGAGAAPAGVSPAQPPPVAHGSVLGADAPAAFGGPAAGGRLPWETPAARGGPSAHTALASGATTSETETAGTSAAGAAAAAATNPVLAAFLRHLGNEAGSTRSYATVAPAGVAAGIPGYAAHLGRQTAAAVDRTEAAAAAAAVRCGRPKPAVSPRRPLAAYASQFQNRPPHVPAQAPALAPGLAAEAAGAGYKEGVGAGSGGGTGSQLQGQPGQQGFPHQQRLVVDVAFEGDLPQQGRTMQTDAGSAGSPRGQGMAAVVAAFGAAGIAEGSAGVDAAHTYAATPSQGTQASAAASAIAAAAASDASAIAAAGALVFAALPRLVTLSSTPAHPSSSRRPSASASSASRSRSAGGRASSASPGQYSRASQGAPFSTAASRADGLHQPSAGGAGGGLATAAGAATAPAGSQTPSAEMVQSVVRLLTGEQAQLAAQLPAAGAPHATPASAAASAATAATVASGRRVGAAGQQQQQHMSRLSASVLALAAGVGGSLTVPAAVPRGGDRARAAAATAAVKAALGLPQPQRQSGAPQQRVRLSHRGSTAGRRGTLSAAEEQRERDAAGGEVTSAMPTAQQPVMGPHASALYTQHSALLADAAAAAARGGAAVGASPSGAASGIPASWWGHQPGVSPLIPAQPVSGAVAAPPAAGGLQPPHRTAPPPPARPRGDSGSAVGSPASLATSASALASASSFAAPSPHTREAAAPATRAAAASSSALSLTLSVARVGLDAAMQRVLALGQQPQMQTQPQLGPGAAVLLRPALPGGGFTGDAVAQQQQPASAATASLRLAVAALATDPRLSADATTHATRQSGPPGAAPATLSVPATLSGRPTASGPPSATPSAIPSAASSAPSSPARRARQVSFSLAEAPSSSGSGSGASSTGRQSNGGAPAGSAESVKPSAAGGVVAGSPRKGPSQRQLQQQPHSTANLADSSASSVRAAGAAKAAAPAAGSRAYGLAAAPLYAAVSLGGGGAGKGAATTSSGAAGRPTSATSKAVPRETALANPSASVTLSGAGASAAAPQQLSALTPSRQRALQLVLAHSAAKHGQAAPAPGTTAEATATTSAGAVRPGAGAAGAGLAASGAAPPAKASALMPGAPFQPQVLSPSFRLSPSSFDSPSTAGRASSSAGTSALLSSSSLLASPPPFPALTGAGVDTTVASDAPLLVPQGRFDGSLQQQHSLDSGAEEREFAEEEEEEGSAAAMLELLRGGLTVAAAGGGGGFPEGRTGSAAQWLDDSLDDAGGGESASKLLGAREGRGHAGTGGSGSGHSASAAEHSAAPHPAPAPRPVYLPQPLHSGVGRDTGGRSEASVAASALDAYLREAASEGGSDDSDEEGSSDAPQRGGAGHFTGAAAGSVGDVSGEVGVSSLLGGGSGTVVASEDGGGRQHGSPDAIAAISAAALQQLRQLRFRTEAVVGGGGFAVPVAAPRSASGTGLPPPVPSRHTR